MRRLACLPGKAANMVSTSSERGDQPSFVQQRQKPFRILGLVLDFGWCVS